MMITKSIIQLIAPGTMRTLSPLVQWPLEVAYAWSQKWWIGELRIPISAMCLVIKGEIPYHWDMVASSVPT